MVTSALFAQVRKAEFPVGPCRNMVKLAFSMVSQRVPGGCKVKLGGAPLSRLSMRDACACAMPAVWQTHHPARAQYVGR
jgi:hypothetical protein